MNVLNNPVIKTKTTESWNNKFQQCKSFQDFSHNERFQLSKFQKLIYEIGICEKVPINFLDNDHMCGFNRNLERSLKQIVEITNRLPTSSLLTRISMSLQLIVGTNRSCYRQIIGRIKRTNDN